jgi:hypothetical protein
MTLVEFLGAASNLATAIGVAVAASQLFATRRQALTTFEDSLNAQYRALVERIPVASLLGDPLRRIELRRLLPHFYHYFDLCNEQAFLYKNARVSKKTWVSWKDGIETNMRRPAFAAAWTEIARRSPTDFDHLRELCPPAADSSIAARA